VSEFWTEKCENKKCGAERRFESQVPTADPDGANWIYIRLGTSGHISSFCGKCSAALRTEFARLTPDLVIPLPESDADRGPIQ
jgi:hypothetical protein